jgi:polysaccharide biosynthesis protein PslH
MNRPTLLVLASRLPFPTIGGDRVRVYFLLRALAEKFDIHLVALHEGPLPDGAVDHLQSWIPRVQVFAFARWRYYFNAVRYFLVARLPLQCGYYLFPQVQEYLREPLKTCAGLICFHVRTTEYARSTAVPKIVDLVDAISMNYERALQRPLRLLWRLVYRIELPLLRRYEVETTRSFDRAWLISPVDRAYLVARGADDSRLRVIPNGVHAVECPVAAVNEDIDILFHGHLGTQSNDAAAHFLLDSIFPLVHDACPAVRCFLVGTSPSPSLALKAKALGVTVTGEVPSVWPYIARTKVVVAPMTFGAGVQNKILEAMAASKPVVMTSLGAEGIDGVHDVHYIVADRPEDFAKEVSRLLADSIARKRLGESGKSLVRRLYPWDRINNIVCDDVEEVLREHPARAGSHRVGSILRHP